MENRGLDTFIFTNFQIASVNANNLAFYGNFDSFRACHSCRRASSCGVGGRLHAPRAWMRVWLSG